MTGPAPGNSPDGEAAWPRLPVAEWQETYSTLHMWTQVVGKIRLALAPPVNHWWHVTLYVTCRGLTTGPIPYGSRIFQISFDFLDHELRIETDRGDRRTVALAPRSVADFHSETMAELRSLGIDVKIWTTPVEVADPIPFERDRVHASYDPEQAGRFWRLLAQADRVLTQFRSGFLGKASPVHFFWGSFDLAVTRFSGRTAPVHPSVPGVPDFITREAYSHEVSSCGFWPGGYGIEAPVFYAYAYPEPPGCAQFPVKHGAYQDGLREFVLPCDALTSSASSDALLLEFLQSTYEAAAETGGWDRAALERAPG